MAERSLENISPTLFIGLGGAGGQVLGRLNRLFLDEFSDQVNGRGASPLQFLLLDTDDREKLPKEVRDNLGSPDRDFLSLSNFNPRRYAERQLAIPDSDLHRWLDPDALQYFDGAIIHDGASRLRMLGRLCLHHRYRTVEQRIREKLDDALDASVHASAQRIRPEPRTLRVFLVSSSLGGTGSAIFLDIACMVNRIARDRGTTPDIQGFVFLPFPFIEKNAQIDPALEAFYQHNAWAFFAELNHLLRHPEQIPEYALDPQRAYGQPPRPFDYGKDLLRTIYLLGDRIPPVGTLELPELFSHVAHGIFHVFLTPEEGTVQSAYSNIKTKLKEPDRISGEIKRFATFGYAEYRLRPESRASHLAWHAAGQDWKNLLGDEEPDPSAIAEGAARLLGVVNNIIEGERAPDPNFDPKAILPSTASILQAGTSPSRVRAEIDELCDTAQTLLTQELARLDSVDLVGRIQQAVNATVADRLGEPPAGIRVELKVLERFRGNLETRCAELKVGNLPLLLDEDGIQEAVQSLKERAATAGKKGFFGFGTAKPLPSSFESDLDSLRQDLSDGILARLKTKRQRRLASALDSLIETNGLLDRKIKEIQPAVGELARHSVEYATGHSEIRSPTIQEIPTSEMLKGSTEKNIGELYSHRASDLAASRIDLWTNLLAQLKQRQPKAPADLFFGLKRLWNPLAKKWLEDEDVGPLELIQEWSDHEAAKTKNGGGNDASQKSNPLERLFGLSYPACPLDEDGLHPEDTIPRITVGVGQFDSHDEAQKQLGVPGSFQLIGNGRGERVALLQTWYAFPSHAVEGMETLRRSYLDRQRKISLPHTAREWNRSNLGERTEENEQLLGDRKQLLQVGRALALSRFFQRPDANGNPVPGMRIIPDSRDKEPFYLLDQRLIDGRRILCWRDISRVEEYRNGWQAVYQNGSRPPRVSRRPNRKVCPLEQDLTAYLGAMERQSHSSFLAAVDEVQKLPKYRGEYLTAYKIYMAKLDTVIDAEEMAGRERCVPLLRRLSDVLHGYVRDLEGDEDLEL